MAGFTDEITISGQEAHHIINVMRIGKGDKLIIFDGKGKEYICSVKDTSRQKVFLKIEKINLISERLNKIKIILMQAIPKKYSMDFIVEKATELGVDRIIPIITERTIPKFAASEKTKKIQRWNSILIAAVKQCGRSIVPQLDGIVPYNDSFNLLNKDAVKIMACLSEGTIDFKKIITEIKTHNENGPKEIAIYIGPEGDFSQKEIAVAQQNGCFLASFGKTVLRVDAAVLFALSVIKFSFDID